MDYCIISVMVFTFFYLLLIEDDITGLPSKYIRKIPNKIISYTAGNAYYLEYYLPPSPCGCFAD